jgi:lipopolysaccharide/colanic/teichoic acid biosynthesis glycosyltransferase
MVGETTVETTSNGRQQGRFPAHAPETVPMYFARKNWPTRIVAAVLLLPAAPLIGLLVLVVRCTSRGPGLFRQTRTGKHGKAFTMYKIRTMYEDAESVTGPTWCLPGDSRITPVGRLLRLLHLDELPQLINIVRGEMDLIGPRPERPSFVNWLTREIPGYGERLRVLPGVTGLAQVNLPPDESVDTVRTKLLLDCLYIRTASVGLDFRIMTCTFLRMIGIRHGRAVRWLRLERPVELPMAAEREPYTATPHWPPPLAHAIAAGRYSSDEENGVAVVAIGNGTAGEESPVAVPEPVSAGTPLARRPR